MSVREFQVQRELTLGRYLSNFHYFRKLFYNVSRLSVNPINLHSGSKNCCNQMAEIFSNFIKFYNYNIVLCLKRYTLCLTLIDFYGRRIIKIWLLLAFQANGKQIKD